MRRLLLCLVVLSMAYAPVMADEVADTLRSALEAYEAGDVAAAREDAEYAVQLLVQQKEADLALFLPETLTEWTRTVGETQARAAVMVGGGLTAEATYASPNGTQVQIALLADSPMTAMFANPSLMGKMGQVRRINRLNFSVNLDGESHGMVGSVLVQV